MNLALFYSLAVHFVLFCLLVFCIASSPIKQKEKAMYTIDFIGQSAEVMRYGAPQQAQGSVKEEPKEAIEETKEIKKEEVKSEIKTETKEKTNTKEYNSKTQISTNPQKKEKKKVTLSKPSVLDQVETDNLDVSALHSLSTAGQGGAEKTVQASFTNFPYPWYITQVRNALWNAWQKTKPKNGQGLSTLVSFNIDKNGAVFEVQIERSSKDDAYD
ncbi:MAG: TonB C-terminal domain-containing protein, partial [Elusimicrobiaceae bacterium]|nr:TonB C-terminal domain-containing protein [Elusimicrobiaceae bacterium]